MQIITVVNSKGGSGKSTLVSNLSIEFVTNNKKILLVDLDPQKTLEDWWKKRKETSPQLLNFNSTNINQALKKAQDEKFEYCMVDTPGYLSGNSLKMLGLSNLVIIPCKPTAADLRAIGTTIAVVEKYKIPFIFILTQCIPKSSFVLKAAVRLGKFGNVSEHPIFNRVSYANAIYEGVSAAQLDKQAQQEIKNNYYVICEILNKRNHEYG